MPLARYEHVRRVLEHKILSGEWIPGTLVPSEHQLVDQYGYSRMTVHRALKELTNAGLLVRKQGKGTYVASPTTHTTIVEIAEVRADIRAQGKLPSHIVESRSLLPDDCEERKHLVGGGDRRILALSILHCASGEPFATERRLLNLDAVPQCEFQRFDEMPPGTWLLEQVPWSDAAHRIRAAIADETTARLLAIPVGASCLVVERRTFFDGQPITWVRFTYPGDSHDLEGTFTYLKPHGKGAVSGQSRTDMRPR